MAYHGDEGNFQGTDLSLRKPTPYWLQISCSKAHKMKYTVKLITILVSIFLEEGLKLLRVFLCSSLKSSKALNNSIFHTVYGIENFLWISRFINIKDTTDGTGLIREVFQCTGNPVASFVSSFLMDIFTRYFLIF
jgi:hypothetical protein